MKITAMVKVLSLLTLIIYGIMDYEYDGCIQFLILFLYRQIDKSTHIEDEKYSDSSLSWRDLYPQVCLNFIIFYCSGVHIKVYGGEGLYKIYILYAYKLYRITYVIEQLYSCIVF